MQVTLPEHLRTPVAAGQRDKLRALADWLRERDMPCALADGGSGTVVYTAAADAETARAMIPVDGRSLYVIDSQTDAFEFCAKCRFRHGPGPTRCPRCGHYVG